MWLQIKAKTIVCESGVKILTVYTVIKDIRFFS